MRENLKSLLAEVIEYFSMAGYRWWLVLAILFGAWDLLASMFPRNEALSAIPEWLPRLAAAIALLVGPFIGYYRLRQRLLKIEQERDVAQADQLDALSAKKMEILYGDASRRTRKQRADGLRMEWEPLAKAIRAGDYSRAAKVQHVAALYLPLLHQIMPYGSAGYIHLRDEIQEVWDLAEKHLFEIRHRVQDHGAGSWP